MSISRAGSTPARRIPYRIYRELWARGLPPLFGIILAVGKLLKLVILELVRIQWMIYLLP